MSFNIAGVWAPAADAIVGPTRRDVYVSDRMALAELRLRLRARFGRFRMFRVSEVEEIISEMMEERLPTPIRLTPPTPNTSLERTFSRVAIPPPPRFPLGD